MTSPRQAIRQRDFSGGEMVEHAKRRDDEAAVRSAARSLSNLRILATGAVEQRPGRSALFVEQGRVEEVRMSPDALYRLCFGDGTLTIRDSDGAVVARAWGYDWDETTAKDIVWDRFNADVIMCFPGQVPKVARWDGSSSWTFLDWTATVTAAGRRLTAFYRFARPGITMTLSALTGTVAVTFSDEVLTSDHVGTRFRYYDRQLTITAVTSAFVGSAAINETMREIEAHDYTAVVTDQFAVGDIAEYKDSGGRHYVLAVGDPSDDELTLLRLNAFDTSSGDDLIGPNGKARRSASAATTISTGPALAVWDEEVMNDYRGWPRSVSVDQGRLIFCDFPGLPDAIAWSALGDSNDFEIGADATDAFLEVAPQKPRVYHVRPGADEFVITAAGLYYIPISESNPLQPGSVTFRRIPGPSAAKVEPVDTARGLLYVNNGLTRVLALVGTGQTAQPYAVRAASDLHSHLFDEIVCIAVDEGNGPLPDEIVYAVNADGSVVTGRYQPGKDWVGWAPWPCVGAVRWVGALEQSTLFTVEYDFGWLVEMMDPDQYLDGGVTLGSIPTALGTGAQADVLLDDNQGTRIGNMTGTSGLYAAFRGATAKAAAACASKSASTTGSVGKTFGQPFTIAKAEIWPASDAGYTDQASVTISLRAKTGAAPADYAADGTELATTGSIADTTSMKTLTSNDEATEWDHAWALLTISSGITTVARLKFYSPDLTHGANTLWFMANATDVSIMDGVKFIGERDINSGGEIVEEEGDAFTDEQLGFGYDLEIEPFVPHMQAGASAMQTMHRRQVGRGAVAVQNSTGFRVEGLRENTATWEILHTRSPYLTGEDQDAAPPQREEVVEFSKLGAAHDPRWRIVKDYPGPLLVLEVDLEIEA